MMLGAAAALTIGAAAHAGISVAYITDPGEPWGQPGNVNALDDVFGAGNWDRLTFAAPGNLFDHGLIIMDAGDGATVNFENFVNANRATMENWVSAGGRMVIGGARWGGTPNFDMGFGVTLSAAGDATGTAVDTNHPIFDGPFGQTGAAFGGSNLAHDTVSGGLTSLMLGDTSGGTILGEKSFGSGHVIAHGLTLAFFENPAWTPNSPIMLRNLYAYAGTPAPGALGLLVVCGLAGRRRRR